MAQVRPRFQAQAAEMVLKTCEYCQHEADSRDFFCDVCHHPLVKTEDRTLEGEQREAADSVLRPNEKAKQWEWVSRGMQTFTAKESKRAKDHFKSARADGYESIPHRYINDVWYRDTMNELGYNLSDMRRMEIEGDPRNRENLFVPMA